MKEIEFSQINELNAQHANAVRNWRAGIVLFPAEALSICYRIASQSYVRRPSASHEDSLATVPGREAALYQLRAENRNNVRSLVICNESGRCNDLLPLIHPHKAERAFVVHF